jgi:MFS family permease
LERGLGPLALLRRATHFRDLIIATFGSAFGTYLAAVALQVHVYDETGSAAWVGALLVAEFLPIVLIGLTLGPLVDRFSRRKLMVAADLVRLAVFCVLPFVNDPATIVGLAGITGVAAGFFRPAVPAALPNLVDDADLPAANSVFQTVENLAWLAGPVVAGIVLAVSSEDVAYWLNAVTFLLSALLIARIPERLLKAERSLSRGHWSDVADGLRVVRHSPALFTVLVVWSVVMLGNGAFNVAEVVFAKESLGAGNLGFGILVGACGLGLTIGGWFGSRAIERFGPARAYAWSLVLWAVGVAAASVSPSLALAAVFVVAGLIGNGVAVVCNILLVQRGAPDHLRGRAFTLIIASNYVLLGVATGLAGWLTDIVGGRWTWFAAACAYAVAAALALAMGRRLGLGIEPQPADEPELPVAAAGLSRV